MPPEVLARIFDPFLTTKRGTGKIGLGMHSVCNLVTQYLGGGIVAHSVPEEGTTFALEIDASHV